MRPPPPVSEQDVESLLLARHYQVAQALPLVPREWCGGTLAHEMARVVRAAFLAHDNNIMATSRALEVSRSTVYRYLAIGQVVAG